MQTQETSTRPTRSTIASFAAAASCGYTLAASASSSSFVNVASQTHSASQARLRGAAGYEESRVPESETQSVPAVIGGAAALALGASLVRRVERRRAGKAVTARKATITATIEQGVEIAVEEEGVLVKKTSVLVMGATGTLGRQVVRQLLNAGYSVRCIVRNKADRPFSFLVDWGATVVEGSYFELNSLPSALVGIHTVIDCSTARSEENVFDIDWDGKKAFIQCCEKMKIQRYLFVSIKDCDKFTSVPMMNIKHMTERFLAKTKLRHTTLRVSGFMQPLISQIAIPVLDDEKVWGDDGTAAGIAYVDSQDAARMVVSAVSKERTVGQTITITGPKIWKTNEVIGLCTELSGKEADVEVVDTSTLKLTENTSAFFGWTTDVAERLQFAEISKQQAAGKSEIMSDDIYLMLGINPAQTRSLDSYVKEYYRRIFKKLTQGNYTPEDGELEKQEKEFEERLQEALNKGEGDKLPDGQPAEEEVLVNYQRDVGDNLQEYFEDRILAKMESGDTKWFGWTLTAEYFNARGAMFGFTLGLFTEWATGVSVANQMDQILTIFTPASAQ